MENSNLNEKYNMEFLLDFIKNANKSQEEIEFENLLKDAGIALNSEEGSILKSYMEKANMPYIKSSEDAWPSFGKGKREQGEPDTLNVRPGNINDFIEELSHAIQYIPRTKDGEYRENMSAIRDSLRFFARHQSENIGDYRYIQPGTVEYQAHSEIAPSIWDEFNDIFIEKFKRKLK